MEQVNITVNVIDNGVTVTVSYYDNNADDMMGYVNTTMYFPTMHEAASYIGLVLTV